jgi:APA family basic amino acid/polyamine antiporter
VPAFGVVASAVLSSVAVIINYIGSSGPTVFTTLILMTGITAAIPYGFSALAQIKWRVIDRRAMHGQRFARDMVVAVLALIFSIGFIYYSRNTGHSWFTYWAPFFLAGVSLLIGIPVYARMKNKMTEPGPVPEYR